MKQFDIYLVSLDPTVGTEMKKTRPCVIISPNEMHFLKTYIIAPLTSKIKNFPTRVSTTINDTRGEIALDQMRAVDATRLVKSLGTLSPHTAKKVQATLLEMFG